MHPSMMIDGEAVVVVVVGRMDRKAGATVDDQNVDYPLFPLAPLSPHSLKSLVVVVVVVVVGTVDCMWTNERMQSYHETLPG